MKKLMNNEMRKVIGGKWKCKQCGEKFWLYINAVQHANGTGHYNEKGADIIWCWW